MMSPWTWIADAALALLLAATLAMAIRLDRALRAVRGDRAAFEALIASLGAATGAIRQGLQALRQEADRATTRIGQRSEDADKMATDLSFLIEAAERAGDILERRVRAATGFSPVSPPSDSTGTIFPPAPPEPAVPEPAVPEPAVPEPAVPEPAVMAGTQPPVAAAPAVPAEALAPERSADRAAEPVAGPPPELRALAGITTRRPAPLPAPAPAAIKLAG